MNGLTAYSTRALTVFRGLPRVARWGVLALLGLLVYLFGIEPLVDYTNRLNADADQARLTIDRAVDQANRREGADSNIASFIARYGELNLPGDQTRRSKELLDKIDAIIKDRHVSDWRIATRRPTPLGRDVMSNVLPLTQEVQRLIFELQFEAAPEVVAGVLADLEKAPEVTMIGQLTLKSIEDKKRVQAVILPEAWIIADKGAKR